MKKTGYEIIGMIKDGKAPKKIKGIPEGHTYNFYEKENVYLDCGIEINMLKYLNDEFEIIEENKVWEPKYGEEYWFITGDGTIYEDIPAFTDRLSDHRDRYELGNCFKTKEEAQKAKEKAIIIAQLKRYAEEHNTEKMGFEKDVHYIGYDYSDKMVRIFTMHDYKIMNNVYFTSRGICERAIKEIGEDNIRKLFEE